jgi:hypothetical protein
VSVHKPGVIWALRDPSIPSGYVRTVDKDTLQVVLPLWGSDPVVFDDDAQLVGANISRKDARLLARRIMQCLDDTRSPR